MLFRNIAFAHCWHLKSRGMFTWQGDDLTEISGNSHIAFTQTRDRAAQGCFCCAGTGAEGGGALGRAG